MYSMSAHRTADEEHGVVTGLPGSGSLLDGEAEGTMPVTRVVRLDGFWVPETEAVRQYLEEQRNKKEPVFINPLTRVHKRMAMKSNVIPWSEELQAFHAMTRDVLTRYSANIVLSLCPPSI
jgi:hypothetical protein